MGESGHHSPKPIVTVLVISSWSCVGPLPTQVINREGVMHDINEFYTVTANLPTLIASAYAQTRRYLRDDLGKS